jgi:hypothetical protein
MILAADPGSMNTAVAASIAKGSIFMRMGLREQGKGGETTFHKVIHQRKRFPPTLSFISDSFQSFSAIARQTGKGRDLIFS